MTYTAENPHADGSAAPGARPSRQTRHSDPPATPRTHDNWMAARQTSRRQQTAPPQPRCSKDVTTHQHRPGARPGRPCPVPACSGQPLPGERRFSSALGNSPPSRTEKYDACMHIYACGCIHVFRSEHLWCISPHIVYIIVEKYVLHIVYI